jgi:predicted aspartyl protease
MAHVVDWSQDYSRRKTGIGRVIRKHFFAFAGHINHSRSIFYVYDLSGDSLVIIENVTMIALSDKHGWAVLQEPPLYSSANEEANYATLIVNNVNIGDIRRKNVVSLGWADGKLELRASNKKKA